MPRDPWRLVERDLQRLLSRSDHDRSRVLIEHPAGILSSELFVRHVQESTCFVSLLLGGLLHRRRRGGNLGGRKTRGLDRSRNHDGLLALLPTRHLDATEVEEVEERHEQQGGSRTHHDGHEQGVGRRCDADALIVDRDGVVEIAHTPEEHGDQGNCQRHPLLATSDLPLSGDRRSDRCRRLLETRDAAIEAGHVLAQLHGLFDLDHSQLVQAVDLLAERLDRADKPQHHHFVGQVSLGLDVEDGLGLSGGETGEDEVGERDVATSLLELLDLELELHDRIVVFSDEAVEAFLDTVDLAQGAIGVGQSLVGSVGRGLQPSDELGHGRVVVVVHCVSSREAFEVLGVTCRYHNEPSPKKGVTEVELSQDILSRLSSTSVEMSLLKIRKVKVEVLMRFDLANDG